MLAALASRSGLRSTLSRMPAAIVVTGRLNATIRIPSLRPLKRPDLLVSCQSQLSLTSDLG
jgi:hypothetical protein